MATIRASCPDCGDVEFTTRDVQARISGEDGSGTYSFRCPGCKVTVVKSAEPRTIDLLLASGVEQATSVLPAEFSSSRRNDPSARAITHDDLLNFHDLLHRDPKWYERLRGSSEREHDGQS